MSLNILKWYIERNHKQFVLICFGWCWCDFLAPMSKWCFTYICKCNYCVRPRLMHLMLGNGFFVQPQTQTVCVGYSAISAINHSPFRNVVCVALFNTNNDKHKYNWHCNNDNIYRRSRARSSPSKQVSVFIVRRFIHVDFFECLYAIFGDWMRC